MENAGVQEMEIPQKPYSLETEPNIISSIQFQTKTTYEVEDGVADSARRFAADMTTSLDREYTNNEEEEDTARFEALRLKQ